MGLDKSYYKYLLYSVLFVIFLRVLSAIPFLINKSYYFTKSLIPYYFKFDSWAYAYNLEGLGISKGVIFFTPLLILVLTTWLLYDIFRELRFSPKIAFMGTILITSYPSFFAQTVIGYVDTNFLIFYSLIGMLYSMIMFLKYIKLKYLFLMGFYMLVGNVWHGFYYIEFCFIISLAIITYLFDYNKKHKLASISIFIILLYIFKREILNRFNNVYAYKINGVGEYLPNTFWGYYFLLCVTLFLFYKYRKFDLKNNKFETFLLVFTIINTIMALFIQRISSFGIVSMGLLFILLLKDHYNVNKKDALLILKVFIAIFVIFSFSSMRFYGPKVNNDIEDLLIKTYITEDNIINFWEYGHIVYYFSGGRTEIRANPKEDSIMFLKGVCEEDGLRYLDLINKSVNYYVFFDTNNIFHYNYFGNKGIIKPEVNTNFSSDYSSNFNYYDSIMCYNNNSIINRTINNIEIEQFKYIGNATLGSRVFYLIQRR